MSLALLSGAVVVILGSALVWEPVRALFRFGLLHLDDLAICGALGIAVFAAMELSSPLLGLRRSAPS